MKRKLALLLAAVMMISLLPMNAFAASTYSLSRGAAGVSKGTLFFEEGLGRTTGAYNAGPITYQVEGSNLIITLQNRVRVGDSIKLELEGAKWYFRNAAAYGLPASSTVTDSEITSKEALQAELEEMLGTDTPAKATEAISKDIEKNAALFSYFNNQNDVFVPKTTGITLNDFKAGNFYFRKDLVLAKYTAIAEELPESEVSGASNDPEDYYLDYDAMLALFGVDASDDVAVKALFDALVGATDIVWYVASNFNGAAYSYYSHVKWPTSNTIPASNSTTDDYKTEAGKDPLMTTYNTANGIWMPDVMVSDSYEAGTYFRFAQGVGVRANGNAYVATPSTAAGTTLPAGISSVAQLPYAMSVTASGNNNKTAILTIMETFNDAGIAATEYVPTGTETYQIVIPLVSLALEESADVRVRIVDENNITGISSVPIRYGATGGATTTTVGSVVTARDVFKLDRITIKETRLNSIKKGKLFLTAQEGFEFAHYAGSSASADVKASTTFDKVDVAVSAGLAWKKADGTYYSGKGARDTDYTIDFTAINTSSSQQGGWVYMPKVDASGNVVTPVVYEWKWLSYPDVFSSWNRRQIVIDFKTLEPSTRVFGIVEIEGLILVPSDYNSSYFGNINVEVTGVDYCGVSKQDLHVATRVDWEVLFTAGTPTTLISGRYNDTVKHADHKTASVTFEEKVAGAWWGGRQIVFKLSDNAKFRAVRFTTVDNVVGQTFKDVDILNQGNKYNYYGNTNIMLDDNFLTVSNLQIPTDKKLKLVMDMWVSVEAGTEGAIELTLAESTETTRISSKTITVANAVPPVDVTVGSVTELNIGYQTIATADITIKERSHGYLKVGESVKVSLSDGISNDGLYFDEKVKVEVVNNTEGKIKNQRVVSSTTYASSSLISDPGSIYFEIDRASTTVKDPMEIVISNVAVKINRTVPESNEKPYDVVVWGSAIAKNFYNTTNAPRDTFATPGIRVPYLAVKTPAQDRNTVFSQVVRVTDGDSVALVDGTPFDMEDTAPYISTKSESMMVPLRFVTYAFGLDKESVLWDPKSETATIIHPTKVIQFTKDSDMMVIDGAAVPMRSPANLPVYAEITNDRIYIPFRMLGNAFGVSVSWEADTKTAVFNAPTVAE